MHDLFEGVGLIQHVTCPTHIGGHTLDLIVTRQSDKLIETTPIADYLFSDHSPVLCQVQVGRPSWKKSRISYRNTKSINLDALREDLSNSNLIKNMLLMDLNQLTISYDNTLSSVLENHTPLITRTITREGVVTIPACTARMGGLLHIIDLSANPSLFGELS